MSCKQTLRFLLGLTALLTGLPFELKATNAAPVVTEALVDRPRGLGLELRSHYRLDPSSHYSDGSDVTAQRAGLGLGLRRPFLKSGFLTAELNLEYAGYNFNQRDDTIFGSSGFMQDAMGLRFSMMGMAPVNAVWGWQAGGFVTVAGETHADLWEAFNGGGLLGANYMVNPDLKLSLSLVAFGFEGSMPVLPIPGIDWKINPDWRLLTPGPGLDLVRRLDERTKLTARGRWEYRQYRLDDDPPVPGGMFYDQRVYLSLEFSRRVWHVLEIALESGCYVYQQMLIRNQDDSRVVNVNGDPSLFVGLRLGCRI